MIRSVSRTFLILGFSLSLNSLAAQPKQLKGEIKCSNLLSDGLNAQNLRAEILLANQLDLASGRSRARASNFIENRAQDIDSSLVTGHVFSLGSGPDIYLPLYLYPNARYFHLVDILTGWGKGPEDVISEIEMRLQSISKQAVVERLDALGDWRKIEGVLPGPLVWRVSWKSRSAGPQEKVFLLHQRDFGDRNSLSELVNFIELPAYRAGLGGILITGMSANLQTRDFLLSHLQPEGSMFTEMLYVNKEGRTSTPDDQAILQSLGKKFEILDYGKIPLEGSLFSPHSFLIRPKNRE